MAGKKSSNKKSKNSGGLAKLLLGKLWKRHGKEMACTAVDQYGQRGVAEAQRHLEQRGDKYGDRGAQLLASHGDRGVEMARARLAQNDQQYYEPGSYYTPAPQRPTTRPAPLALGGRRAVLLE